MAILVSQGVVESGVYLSNNQMTVFGVANYTSIYRSGYLYVSSGGVANITFNSGGYVYVYSGGSANYTALTRGYYYYNSAYMYVSGGVANNTTINNGGHLYVESGGRASNTTINTYGYLYVESGGVANSAAVNIGGYLFVSSGGSALNIVENGGYVSAAPGANVTFTPNTISGLVLSGTSASLHSGTVASNTTIKEYGRLFVSSGGRASNTTVNTSGGLVVSSGGRASNTTVNTSGGLVVSSGGIASNITVNGDLFVTSGGSALDVVVTPFAGKITVEVGGHITYNTEALSGVYYGWAGRLFASTPYISGATLYDDTYSAYIYSGGKMDDTIVSGGKLFVEGGTANSTTLHRGELHISSGGVANDTDINSGGYLCVENGGAANGITVNSGGNLYVESGGSALDVVFTPFTGEVTVEKGGYFTYNKEAYTGVYYGWAGSLFASTAYISGATLYNSIYSAYIYNGGKMDDTIVSGGKLFVEGGTANSTTLHRGELHISSGGVASNTTVHSNGYIYLENGGSAVRTTVNSSGYFYINGGTARDMDIYFLGQSYVEDGGIVNNASIHYLGHLYVNDGGSANSTFVNYLGHLYVNDGGSADSSFINYLGHIYVKDGGTANNTVIDDLGHLYVEEGGTAGGTTIQAGGFLHISSGGLHKGEMNIGNGFVSAASGSIIDFTVAGRDLEDGFLINDLSLITGAPHYTITVEADQAYGEYLLADKVDTSFALSLTIGTEEAVYGSISVNDRQTIYNNTAYYLVLEDGELSLIIGEPDTTPPEAPVALADITAPTNGNVTVTASFSSDSVIKEYSFNGSDWMDYTSPIILTENGVLYFRSMDEAGNISEITSCTVENIDRIAPETPVATANITTLTNSDVTVSVIYSSDSVIKEYSFNGSDWMDYTGAFTVTENGTISFRAGDAAGNISESELVISNIDKTPPTAPVALMDITAPTNGDVTVTASFSSDSVVKEYSLDGSFWRDYTSAITMRSNGILYFRSMDEAGNISEITSCTVENIDKIPPTAPVAIANITSTTSENVIVSAAFSQDSFIREYSFNGSDWQNYTSAISMSSNGILYFRGRDEAGNYSGITTYAVENIIVSGKVNIYNEEGEIVSAGTLLSGAVLERPDMIMHVSSGGTANGTIIHAEGELYISNGGITTNTLIHSGGTMEVYDGGTADMTALGSFGSAVVHGGATVNNTSIGYAAEMTVLSGGLADTNTIDTWGAVILSSGAIGNSTTILASGGYHIYNGAVAYTTMITSGAFLGIGLGGTVYNLDVQMGAGAQFFDESILRGWNDFAGTVTVGGADEIAAGYTVNVDAAGSMINFVLTDRASNVGNIINNAAGITGASYFVTVDSSKASGRYYLAGNAASIDSLTITGTSTILKVGGGATLDGNTYFALDRDIYNNLYLDVAKVSGIAASCGDLEGVDLGTWDEIETGCDASLATSDEKKDTGILAIA